MKTSTIIFATGNSSKATSMQRYFDRYGLPYRVEQRVLELIEPQADTATEVARSKAMQAYEQLQCPVVVDDSSFHIAALGGFPGPYAKYMIETLGAEGIVHAMEGRTDRSAYFLSTLVYVDTEGAVHEFEDKAYRGTIAHEVDDFTDPAAWSDLSKIFIPEGLTVSLARRDSSESANSQVGASSYDLFCTFLSNTK